ncbi:hypothetical protein GFB49_17635 [Epibacterium sp. SM1979]|uniref:DUF1330 domain-containing protein n=1 Tax=Tritonibacter litoralis TaxID=2662264 RepID=A0A843YM66_9RHOB|nr:hypothetical protein [Tritonibacter litoralis]MQQ10293.1 hypothetical protein [Tritonibacter litoralis]
MTYVLVDILPLKKGKSVADAMSYFDKVKPAMERHGLTRLNEPLEAHKMLRGTQTANLVNLFETVDPESSMQGMASDPEYQSYVPLRDTIFDLDNASIILTSRFV